MSVLASGQVGSSPVGAYRRRFSCFYFESRVSSRQQKSLDEDFLKDAVIDRVKDDVPEVVAAALKVLEVSETIDEATDAAALNQTSTKFVFYCRCRFCSMFWILKKLCRV